MRVVYQPAISTGLSSPQAVYRNGGRPRSCRPGGPIDSSPGRKPWEWNSEKSLKPRRGDRTNLCPPLGHHLSPLRGFRGYSRRFPQGSRPGLLSVGPPGLRIKGDRLIGDSGHSNLFNLVLLCGVRAHGTGRHRTSRTHDEPGEVRGRTRCVGGELRKTARSGAGGGDA